VKAPTTLTTTTTAAPAPANVQPAVEAAQAAIGASYASGATGPSAFDCSGLMVYAFGAAGIALPRTSFAQFETGTEVGLTEIQAGDLVFFDTAGAGASHVGIALSPETAISATTHGVMEHPIATGYWGEHLIGARRVG
jgi:cell wall-associated NlpC family hydrolase